MLSKVLRGSAILLVLASCALAQEAGDVHSAEASGFIPRIHGPRLIAPGTRAPFYDPVRHLTVSYNTIWAGYAVTGSDFTEVQGSWIVNAVDCTKTPNSDSSEWVGIDGWSSNTVEQVGTDADCYGGKPFYYVWYEFFPLNTIVIPDVSIRPGDKFSAAVVYDGNNEYTVSITNETGNESFSKQVEFTGADGSGPPLRDSAEWIEEMDGDKLADFNHDLFGEHFTNIGDAQDFAMDSTVAGVIKDFGDNVQESISTRNGHQNSKNTAVPSAISSDGASFGVIWKAE